MRTVNVDEVTLELTQSLGIDEILTVRTDLGPKDRRKLGRALGRHWGMRFRQTEEGLIWMRSCTTAKTLKIHPRPLSWYTNRIKNGKPFAFLRWGDYLATETVFEGFGFQEFTPELRADIRRVLEEYVSDPAYVMATTPIYHFVRLGLWGHVAHLFAELDLLNIHWVSTEVFNRAMHRGELGPFIQALRSVRVLVVGPLWMRPVTDTVLPSAAFLAIPPNNAHEKTSATMAAILAHPEVDVIMISAGPAAQVWTHDLWMHLGQTTSIINWGSTWAPFVGKMGHKSHANLTEETMRRNRGEQA